MALAFWGVQTLVQLYWVRNLFIYDATEIGALEALPYAPLYAAGTVCLGASPSFRFPPTSDPSQAFTPSCSCTSTSS
jgi:hypothetical protein